MKNTAILFALVLSLGFTGTAHAFTDYGVNDQGKQCLSPVLEDGTCKKVFIDYGVNAQGKQCYDQKDENGECDLAYSNDLSIFGDAKSLNVRSSAKIAQPNALTAKERLNHQRGVRKAICRIMGC